MMKVNVRVLTGLPHLVQVLAGVTNLVFGQLRLLAHLATGLGLRRARRRVKDTLNDWSFAETSAHFLPRTLFFLDSDQSAGSGVLFHFLIAGRRLWLRRGLGRLDRRQGLVD